MSKKEPTVTVDGQEVLNHFMVSGNVTGHLRIPNGKQIVDDVTTYPTNAVLVTEGDTRIPLREIARAQSALQQQYVQRLPDPNCLMKILDVQITNIIFLGKMTREEFYEGMPDMKPAEGEKGEANPNLQVVK